MRCKDCKWYETNDTEDVGYCCLDYETVNEENWCDFYNGDDNGYQLLSNNSDNTRSQKC